MTSGENTRAATYKKCRATLQNYKATWTSSLLTNEKAKSTFTRRLLRPNRPPTWALIILFSTITFFKLDWFWPSRKMKSTPEKVTFLLALYSNMSPDCLKNTDSQVNYLHTKATSLSQDLSNEFHIKYWKNNKQAYNDWPC